jgi:flagellar motor switch protein FliN
MGSLSFEAVPGELAGQSALSITKTHKGLKDDDRSGQDQGSDGLRLLENIGVKLTVEVGPAELTIRDLLRLSEGSVIELDRLAGDPLDVLVNGTLIAKGEVVMVGERFGIRFGQIVDPEKRAETL